MMRKPKPNISYEEVKVTGNHSCPTWADVCLSSWIEELPSSFGKHSLQLEIYDKVPMHDNFRLIWGQSNLRSRFRRDEKAEEVRR